MKIYKRIKKTHYHTLHSRTFVFFHHVESLNLTSENLENSSRCKDIPSNCYLVHFTLLKNNYFDVGTKYFPNNETLFHYCKIEHKFIKGRYDALHSRTFCIRSR